MESSLIQQLKQMMAPVLDDKDLTVLEIARHESVVRIVLDRPDGSVGIDDCTSVSRFLSHALDVEDIIPGQYSLEVSSPGLDRPLYGPADYRRFSGRLCRIKLVEPMGGNYVLVGRIGNVGDDSVTLEVDKGTRTIAHDNVAQARLEVEF